MNKLIPSVLIVLAVCVLAVPASAEIYQYRDARGHLHFTDDIAHVPESRRAKVKKYKELKSRPRPVDSSRSIYENPAGNGTWSKNLLARGSELAQEKKELDRKYAALEHEKNALSRKLSKNASPGQNPKYAEEVSELNRRIAAYESQRKEFQAKVSAYKEKINNPGNAAR